jgi:hypothetical protein
MLTKLTDKEKNRVIAALLFFLVLVLGYWRMVPGVCGFFHDDAIYVITAKALAHGQGYKLIFLPHAPIQTKFPILYPALLAMIWKLWPSFPNNLVLMKWLTLVFGAATVGLSYLYVIRFGYFPNTVAGIAALFCASSSIFLYFSTETLSEMPFAFLVIIGLWFFEAQLENPRCAWYQQFLAGVLLALPFLCRTVGVTLIFAGLVAQFYQGRSLRSLGWMMAGIAIVMLPWIAWMFAGLGAWNHNPILGYYTDYLGWWAATGLGSYVQFVLKNFLNIIISSVTGPLEGFTNLLRSINLWSFIFFIISAGSIIYITLIGKLRSRRVLPLFVVSYLLLILLWPWDSYRFLIPILPFLLGYLFDGIYSSLRAGKVIKWFLLVGLGLLMLANFKVDYQHSQQANRFCFSQAILWENPPAWTSYQHIFQWLRSNSQPDDVMASMEDPMVFLYSGRRAIRPFKITPCFGEDGPDSKMLGSADDLYQTLKTYKIKYLIEFPMLSFGKAFNGLIAKLEKKYPGSLKKVYSGKDKRFVVFKFIRSG